MAKVADILFIRRSDGTLLLREPDGSCRPAVGLSDLAKLAALTDAEIEVMAASDPDHPALDEEFWAGANERAG